MKLTNMEIKNFRGIKHASVLLPQESRSICLISSGDRNQRGLVIEDLPLLRGDDRKCLFGNPRASVSDSNANAVRDYKQ